MYSKHFVLLLPYISASVQITGVEGTPTAGQNFSRICRVLGTRNSVNYQWNMKSEDTGSQRNISANKGLLNFSSLKLSDAGVYTCVASISVGMSTYVYVSNETISIKSKTLC